MPPDLIAALSPPAAPPGSIAQPGGAAAALTGSPNAGLFASLLAATAPPALAVFPLPAAPAPATVPLMHTTTVLSKIKFSPISASPGTDPTEPVAPTPKKPVLWETEHLGPAAPPAPLLLPSAPLIVQSTDLALAEVTAKDAAPEGTKDAVSDGKKDTKKEPMDTAPAPVPTGELLLPPPPPPIIASLPALPVATPPALAPPAAGVSAVLAVPETAEALTPAARLAPELASATPAQAAPLTQTALVPQAAPLPQTAPVVWTPPAAASAASVAPLAVTPVPAAVPVPSAAPAALVPAMLIGVGDSAAPVLPARMDKNAALKTPQKDLKTAGASADTYTRTQTELPRLTHLTRKDTPTEETSTEESRMDAGGTQGQGPAPTLLAAPLPQTQTASAASEIKPLTETKPLTQTEKLAIVQQLADGAGSLRLSAKSGAAQEMTVQLHPKDWGSLHVTVQIAPAAPSTGGAPTAATPKTVTAQIVAETPQVKAALESHTGELHQKLREAGLHLDSVTVTVRTPEAKSSGMTPQGSQTDAQGRFQDGAQAGTQGSLNGNTQSQAGTQGSEFGQRLTDFSGRPEGSLSGSAAGLQNNSQNSSQGGRQGSQTPHEALRWAGTEPDTDDAPHWAASRHSGAVRLDLRA